MAQNEAYRRAERKIEIALMSGKELDLSMRWGGNSEKLTELPESLGQLTQLQSLDLSGNRLTELPASFGQLAELRELDLGNNQLKVLPQSMRHVRALSRL